MRVILAAAALIFGAFLLSRGDYGTAAFLWATERQREFQNAMAGALQAIRAGDGLALLSLCTMSAGYGFVHALGPGHGKLLLGGAAASGLVPMRRMIAIGLAASLAQSGTAILLVAVGVKVLALTSQHAIALAEGALAAVSYVAIAVIGLAMMLRGFRAARIEAHPHDCGCGHHHGPTADEIARARSPAAALALIGSIAIRPCSGALFLLVIAWRFGIVWQGILAVIAMGLGTAAFNTLAIGGGGTMRRLAGSGGRAAVIAQIAAGGIIALLAGQMAWQFI
ncbi:hypothetical protein QCN27_00005 [Cereibacter sp. SYSU M97828]|nr:hypothetical protein [Cereibacter flavus]